MKLVRYGRAGAEKPGLIDANGTLRDLSRVVRDITPAVLSPAGLKRLRAVKPSRLPVVRGRPRLGCPVSGVAKIVCIGLNYTDHAHEVGLPLPAEPLLFLRSEEHTSELQSQSNLVCRLLLEKKKKKKKTATLCRTNIAANRLQ